MVAPDANAGEGEEVCLYIAPIAKLIEIGNFRLPSVGGGPVGKAQKYRNTLWIPSFLGMKKSNFSASKHMLIQRFAIVSIIDLGISLTPVTPRGSINGMEDYPRTLLELERRFSSEEACREYLAALRWPEGFYCPACGSAKAWRRKNRASFTCAGCGKETRVTSGTIF